MWRRRHLVNFALRGNQMERKGEVNAMIALRVTTKAAREPPNAPSVTQATIKKMCRSYLVIFVLRDNQTKTKAEVRAIDALRVVLKAAREPRSAPGVSQASIKTICRSHLVRLAPRDNMSCRKGALTARHALRVGIRAVREPPSATSVRQAGIKTMCHRLFVNFAPGDDMSRKKGIVNVSNALRVLINRRLEFPSV